jgi:2,7-dihydroxy-5-methyl-1-naphthoate 7-O-methyltransferase
MTAMGADRPGPADLSALSDLTTPWCIRVVATLGIAQHIADGVTGLAELAAATGCDAKALASVLCHLVDQGIFQGRGGGMFVLNEAARGLLEPAQQLSLDLDGIGGRMALTWSTLLTYVRTGRPGYADMFGRSFWEDLEAHPALAASFDGFMAAVHGEAEQVPALLGGWDAVASVVDVGGGVGHVLANLLRAHPKLRGTLVDLPATVARAGPRFAEAGVADRVIAIGQSFFDPLPPGGEVYLLSRVLNDWPDAEKVAILGRCAEAARPSGRVVVAGGVCPDGTVSRISVDKVLTGGDEVPLAEFRALALRAGLEVSTDQAPGTGHMVVECRPLQEPASR